MPAITTQIADLEEGDESEMDTCNVERLLGLQRQASTHPAASFTPLNNTKTI